MESGGISKVIDFLAKRPELDQCALIKKIVLMQLKIFLTNAHQKLLIKFIKPNRIPKYIFSFRMVTLMY